MSSLVTYSIPEAVLETLIDKGRRVDMTHTLYAKYAMLAVLEVLEPEDVASYRKQYERRSVDEKVVSSFKEKVRQAKPWRG